MPVVSAPAPDFIPDSDFTPDAHAPAPDFIPDGHPMAPGSHGADFIPDSKFVPDSQTYGTATQQLLAGAEGLARGASLGGSDLTERALGLSTPEAMAARARENPWTSGIGSMVGAGALSVATGGGPLIAEGLGGGALAGAVGLGAEGAVFGAGNGISEAALGDGQLNGEKMLSHIGWGAAMGGGIGAVAGKLGAFAPGIEHTIDPAALEDGGPPLMESAPAQELGPVKSTSELQQRIANAQAAGLTYELPQKSIVLDAASRLPDLQIPLLPQQAEALGSRGLFDDYRILYREGDSEAARLMQDAEAIQKADIVQKTGQAVDSLSPLVKPTVNEVEGGTRAIEAFTEQYQAEQKAMKPVFNQLEKVDLGPLSADIVPLMETLANRLPGLSRMFEYGEDGLPKEVAKFDAKWGVSKQAYNAVKDVFESLEAGAEEPASFQDLINLRDSMDNHMVLGDKFGAGQILGLKSAFMDYLQNLGEDHIPDLQLRNLFRRYAINQQNRRIVEKVFGASVGTRDFAQYMPKPAEDILGKIFRNTETVKAAKRILDPAKFDELLASHLATVRDGFTKNGVFSSNNFLNYLRRHAPELGEAFSHRPDVLQRLKDLTTFSTIIPDAAPMNPPRTAKTLMGLIKNLSLGEVGVGALNPKLMVGIFGKKAMEMLKDAHAERSMMKQLNSGLAGRSAQQINLEGTQKLLGVVNANIERGARAIFKNEEPKHGR